MVVLVGASPTGAQAQRSLPFSDDALVLNFGQVRTGAHGSWSFYDQLYGEDGKVQNYGAPLSFASAGSGQFSSLRNGESAIRLASGQTGFQLSLGTTDVSATNRSGTTALLLDVGLPGRFMLSVEVPFVRVESTISISANNGKSNPANVGINPASTSTSVFASDTALANQISRARAALSSQLASCLGSTAASCTTVNAKRTEAQALVTLSGTVAAGISTLAFSPFAPLSTSAAQLAITARISSIASSFRDFGINSVTGTSVSPATAPITAGQYRALAESQSLGAGGALPSYKTFTRLGDVSVAAKFRLVDADKVRAAAFGKVFFPTGGELSSGEVFPIAAGEGTTRLEAGGIADAFTGSKLSVTASASGLIWLPANVNTRSGFDTLTLETVSPVPRTFLAHRSQRTGFNISLTPRYALNRWMTVGAQYTVRTLSAEDFTANGTEVMTWNSQEAITDHRAGAGFSFSNLAASRTRGPRFPIEASFFHSQTISGKGLQPKIFSDEFRIRIFARR